MCVLSTTLIWLFHQLTKENNFKKGKLELGYKLKCYEVTFDTFLPEDEYSQNVAFYNRPTLWDKWQNNLP